MIRNCGIKQNLFFFFMTARLGLFGPKPMKTILCLNRKETWGKKSRKAEYAVLREGYEVLMTMYYFE